MVVAQRHIYESAHPGGYDPQIRTRPRFLYNAPTLQVSRCYVYSLGSYRADERTNKQNEQTDKQTPLKTSNDLRYAMTLGKKIPAKFT